VKIQYNDRAKLRWLKRERTIDKTRNYDFHNRGLVISNLNHHCFDFFFIEHSDFRYFDFS
jgi:hypothetical protein